MEYEKLCRLVEQWNENRLDLFHLSQPTKDLEVEGVMRFYFCDHAGRVCTKCIRVSSTATTQAVIEALVDKFLPDLKMLTEPDYTLWEVHEGGEERRLNGDEKPLLVQLNWHKDDKEGRFLLKKHGMNFLPIQVLKDHDESANIKRSNKRFSKREKKEDKIKKKEIIKVHEGMPQESMDAMGLYKQVPPTTFTRTISNPEIVMKKRREKKIESKLKEMGHGGSLKIYGEEIEPSRPYVTILVSARDRTSEILREALAKYNVREEEWRNYQLVQVEIEDDGELGRSLTDLSSAGQKRERALGEDEAPLLQLAGIPPNYTVFFSIRRRNGGEEPRTPPSSVYLITPDNTSIPIAEGVTEIGSDPNLHLFARHHLRLGGLCNRHAVITLNRGVFTLTPSAPEALIMVNDRRIDRTESVQDGDWMRLGRDHLFRLTMPMGARRQVDNQSVQSVVNGRRDVMNDSRNTSFDQDAVQGHVLPLSVSIQHGNMTDLLIESMSRSCESSPFVLSSSFSLFIGIHSLSHQPSIPIEILNRFTTHISRVSKEWSNNRSRLLYWLSNTSHLHHLLSTDICFSLPLEGLAEVVQSLFHSLVAASIAEMNGVIPTVFNQGAEERAPLLTLLNSILSSCRSSLLNADITIQLASQLFSSLNASLFNQMVHMRATSSLGHLISSRLDEMDEWATGMGVELAAECLMDTTRQASNLLMARKDDMASMGATAYKLNSLQIRHLLSSFDPSGDEMGVGADVLHRMIGLAERQADEMDGDEAGPLSLLESHRLEGIPLTLPHDGFFLETQPTLFEPLRAFMGELAAKGICSNVRWNDNSAGWVTDRLMRVQPQPAAAAAAARPNSLPAPPPISQPPIPSYHHAPPPPSNHYHPSSNGPSSPLLGSPKMEGGSPLVKVHLNRGSGGIGLSIVAAQGVGDTQCGIYIKKVLDGSCAAKDGRLNAGDELIWVNEKSLRGLSQEEAARHLSQCGPVVRFLVRPGAAAENGLMSYLISPETSPQAPQKQSLPLKSISPSPSSLYTPFNNRRGEDQMGVSHSTGSAFSVPHKAARSISTSDLYHNNDPNQSFSGRSIASSTASAFSALPSHYKRPTVIQPGRNCPSPSNLRSGAISPSLLSHSRRGVSPTPLSQPGGGGGGGSMQHLDLINSPPLSRSSPLPVGRPFPQSQSLNFNQSMESNGSMNNSMRMHHLPPRAPTEAPSIPSMRNVAQSAASIAMNRRKEATTPTRSNYNALIDGLENDFSRVSVETERRYGEIMGGNSGIIQRPPSVPQTPVRRETLIDDVADYDIDSPSIVGAQEVYRDPRSKMMNESFSRDSAPISFDGSKLAFGDKMRLFANRIGENTPPTRMTTSSAQRIIQDDL